jgi:transposase
MTEREWQLIAPFMPLQPSRGRKRTTDLRRVIDAVFYLLQSGCQWGLLPKDFPPKSTVHFYFTCFEEDGTWTRIHDTLYRQTRELEGKEESPSYAIIDSQSAKTGPDAREMVGFDAPLSDASITCR